MPFWDRLLRSLFVAVAVGLGWGIRGRYGHSLGAMIPGASLGMALAFVSGQPNAMRWMPILGAVAAFFISIGGMMSYGLLHGYAQSDTFINYSYGFFTLLLEGGAWGGFCGAALGLLLERQRLTLGEAVSAVATAFAGGWLTYFVVVDVVDFHINPGRNDTTINFVGQIIALFGWMIWNKRWMGLRGLALGCMGFGLGMALGRLTGNAMRHAPFEIAHWTTMETTCGFIGGLVVAFGLLGRRLDDMPEERGWRSVSVLGVFYIMAFIPLLHRLTRITLEGRPKTWSGILNSRGIADPQAVSAAIDTMLWGIDAICVVGFLFAGVWLALWRQDRQRWAAFPILAFNLLMLTFLSLDVFYLHELRQPQANSVNMHTVFWTMYGLLAVFALLFETVWPRRDVVEVDEVTERIPWRRWLGATAGTFVTIVACASLTNGPLTMTNAQMRWPVWSSRDGSPPGRTPAEKPAASDVPSEDTSQPSAQTP